MFSLLLFLMFIPIITAIFIYILENKRANALIFLAQTIQTYIFFRLIAVFPVINNRSYVLGNWTLDSGISLKVDNLSLAFIGLSLFIWWMVLIYAWDQHKSDSKFLFFLLFLEGTFLGFLMVDDLFTFFVFIDIITILSAILVVYKKDGWSLRSGLYYLLINSMGMLTYLMGLIIVYLLCGTLNWNLARLRLASMPVSMPVITAYILMCAAIGVKAAFFPTFNWLSRAHGSAPAPISALLSALLVKGGLYGFIRIQELFSGGLMPDFFFNLGFVTAILGAILAIAQKDIKQLLAFSTISQVGIILIGIANIQTNLYYGGLIHLFTHALFKCMLFMGAGILVNAYKSRRLTEIRGVATHFPLLSLSLFVGLLSVMGAPFFSGYLGKYILASELSGSPYFYLLQLVNLGTIITYLKFSQIFWSPDETTKSFVPSGIHLSKAARLRLNLPLLVLSGLSVLVTFGFNLLGSLLEAEFPPIHLLSLDKALWWLGTFLLAVLISKTIIFSDRATPFLHRLRTMRITFYNTAYAFILLMATMFIFSACTM